MMRRLLRNTTVAASLVALAAGPWAVSLAGSQYQDPTRRDERARQQDERSRGDRQRDPSARHATTKKNGQQAGELIRSKSRQVSGTVTNVKQIEVRGEGGRSTQNLIAQIRTKEGNRRLTVDLGPAQDLRNRIRRGSEIQVQGPVVSIQNRPLLVAERVRFQDNGQTSMISRAEQEAMVGTATAQAGRDRDRQDRQQDRDRQGNMPAEQSRQLSGEILMVKDVENRETDTRNKVALVSTTKANQRMVVDFGPADKAQQIRKGVDVRVEGPVRMVDGRQVLVAERFRMGGETTQVDRTAEMRAAGQADTAIVRGQDRQDRILREERPRRDRQDDDR